MSKFELHEDTVVYTDGTNGAILLKNGGWSPFRYFDDGNLDIGDEVFFTHLNAYKWAVDTYT